MPDNFFVTAERMHDSSKVLCQANHHHNACYMAGYVGECYLKLLVVQIPSSPRSYGHKIIDMERDIRFAITSGRGLASMSHYLIDMAVDCPNIRNWSPNYRYDDSAGWDAPAASSIFQQEQEKCFNQIAAMYVAGIIR